MLPSKAKTVFNVSHLADNSCFLSSDVAEKQVSFVVVVVVVVLLFYVHNKHLRSCRDGQLT